MALVLVCLFIVNDVAWAQSTNYNPSNIATLAAQSRLKPFFEKYEINFKNTAAIIYAAGQLRNWIKAGPIRESHIVKLNNYLRNNLHNSEVEIGTDIERGSLTSGKQYALIVFKFNKGSKEIKTLFFKGYTNLSSQDKGELKEFKIKNDTDIERLYYPGLEGVWFIDPSATPEVLPALSTASREKMPANKKFASFIQAHEIFHLLVDKSWVYQFEPEEEDRLADIFARMVSGLSPPAEEIRFFYESCAKLSGEAQDFLRQNLSCESPEFLPSLHELGINISKIKLIQTIAEPSAREAEMAARKTAYRGVLTGAALSGLLLYGAYKLFSYQLPQPKGPVAPAPTMTIKSEQRSSQIVNSKLAPKQGIRKVVKENMPEDWDGPKMERLSMNAGIGSTSPYQPPAIVRESIVAKVEGPIYGRPFQEIYFNFQENGNILPADPLSLKGYGNLVGQTSIFYRRECAGKTMVSPLMYIGGVVSNAIVRPIDKNGNRVPGQEIPCRVVNGRFAEFDYSGRAEIETEVSNYEGTVLEYKGTDLPENELRDFPLVFNMEIIKNIRQSLSHTIELQKFIALIDFEEGISPIEKLDRIARADFIPARIKLQAIANAMNKHCCYNGAYAFMNRNDRSWGSTWQGIIDSGQLIRLTCDTSSRMFVLMCQRLGIRAGYVRIDPLRIKDGFIVEGGVPHAMAIIEIEGGWYQVEATKLVPLEAGIVDSGGTSIEFEGVISVFIASGVIDLRLPTSEGVGIVERKIEPRDSLQDATAKLVYKTLTDGFKKLALQSPEEFSKFSHAVSALIDMASGKLLILDSSEEVVELARKDACLELLDIAQSQIQTNPDSIQPSLVEALGKILEVARSFGIPNHLYNSIIETLTIIEKARPDLSSQVNDILKNYILVPSPTSEPSSGSSSRGSKGLPNDAYAPKIQKARDNSGSSGLPFVPAQNEAKRIHSENLNNPPNIPQNTILCHVIPDSILPDEQQKQMLQLLDQNMRRNKDYTERVIRLKVSGSSSFVEELIKLMAREIDNNQKYNVQFCVACPDTETVGKVLEADPKVKALAFDPCEKAVQVEGIMLALRALYSDDIENLKRAFNFLAEKQRQLSPEQLNITDINEFVRKVTFILPSAKELNINDVGKLNKLIRENIEAAA